MSNYRVPKNVVEESRTETSEFASVIFAGLNLDLRQVQTMFDVWSGIEGRSWASKIIENATAPARLLEGVSMNKRDMMDGIPEMPEEPYGVDTDVIPDSIMAADAAMDAAQDLLEPYESQDPVICQAYYLIKAADAALGNAIAALGLKDADEEISLDNMPADLVSEVEMNSTNLDVETSEVVVESNEERAVDGIGEGTFVSWDSSGGRARGKVLTVNTEGTVKSSSGFALDATEESPVFEIQIYSAKDNGFIPTDTITVHKSDTLTVIDPLPSPRSEETMFEERKGAFASAERVTMDAEVRSLDTEDGALKIAGYAAQFNKEATGLSFREVIAPGAFSRSLQSGEPVYLLVNHDTNGIPLASTASGTLNLSEDEVGLRMEADLDPANPKAQELFSAISRGDIAKMSFAFTVAPNGSSRSEGLRTLTDLNLFEVSAVTWPAYNDTALGARSAEDAQAEALELRRRLLQLKQKFTK